MANTTLSTDKTSYNADEVIHAIVASSNLSPAVPPTVVQRFAHVVRTYTDGEVDECEETRNVTTDPGSPAQTILSTEVVLLDAPLANGGQPVPGASVTMVDPDHYDIVAK